MAGVKKDKKKIEELLSRGVEAIYPSKEWLKKELISRRLKIYFGIDPTAPTLHLGNMIALMKLAQFQELGHEIVLLIGSFTGMIGDPTDKTATRQPLTRKQVLENAKKYKQQAGIFINFGGRNPAKMVYNHTWLDKMNLKDVAELGMLTTAQRLLERDMFQERIRKGAPIHFTELMYPLLQGFDSVVMKVDGEIGGNDQTFNMLMGRDLARKMLNKEKFVLTMKLLTDPTGKKMGKSEGNMINITETAKEMVGKVMSWPDETIATGFELCTRLPLEEIAKISRKAKNPKEIKLRLAEEIAAVYHGQEKAKAARAEWEKTFSKKEVPTAMEEVELKKGAETLLDLVVRTQKMSKSEARRLLKQGGIKVDGQKEEKEERKLKKGEVVKIGKKRFLKIK